MYICICQGVTDKEINSAIAQGCCSLPDLQARTGLGTQCGRCCEEACRLLCQAKENSVPLSQAGRECTQPSV